MRLHRIAGAAIGVALAVVPGLAHAQPASANARVKEAVPYRPPVDAPLTDTFRPPATSYGAGNRGVDFATEPGQPVLAAADGEVVFAGRVGHGLHVTVLHGDGLRTSYSFLADLRVRRGQRVRTGDEVGVAGESLHFGARAGEAYVDPLALLDASRPARVWLVADDLRRPLAESVERALLARALRGVGRVAGQLAGSTAVAVAWAAKGALDVAAAVPHPPFGPSPAPLLDAAAEWFAERDACTPRSTPTPHPPSERRLAVLVGGLGSSSGQAAILDVDTDALGYAAADTVQFSYAGGTTADTPYGPGDTQVDIGASGARLRALLDRLAAQHPGVPIDVLAHSQGGLVARRALGDRAPPTLRTLVTLATPHHGADIATAGARLRGTTAGAAALEAAGALRPMGIDPTSPSITQLAESSSFLDELNARPLPPGPRYVSIAARLDLIVPSPRTRLAGAEHTVVDLPLTSINAHDVLPGSPAATRELALALAGQPLSCRGLAHRLVDTVVGHGVGAAEDAAGHVLTTAAGP